MIKVTTRDEKTAEVIDKDFEREYRLFSKGLEKAVLPEIIKGTPVFKGVVKGRVKLIDQKASLSSIPKNMVLVTQMTKPDMIPALKHAKAIVTDEGGVLCHAANIMREFKIVGITGAKIATSVLKDGDYVEVDADKGIVKKLAKIRKA